MTVPNTQPGLPDYASLFQAGNIGRLRLDNRLIMPAMGNALSDEKGTVTGAMLEYYRVRAAGGVGMIITQFAAVSADGIMPYNLNLCEDRFIPELEKLVRVIHEEGAKACIQIMHPGMLFLLFKNIPQGITIKVPAITPWMAKDKPFQAVSEEDIEKYIRDFALAARRVKETGADAVELHACHGCLLSTFLSPAVNRRTDNYGESVENRARFARRVVEEMRGEVGAEFPLIVRINGCDDVVGGVSTEEVIQQAKILGAAGADAISISSGLEYWSTLMAPSYLTPEGPVIPAAAEVKKATGMTVIAAGKISPEAAERAVGGGRADFIALGRPLLADPELPNKLKRGDGGKVVRCLHCNNCLRTSWRSCTVNPFLYRETTPAPAPAAAAEKVMVIGGGLAGLQVAVLCKQRGYKVSVFEKEAAPGGQWAVACKIPGKQEYASIIKYLTGRLEELGVPVFLNTGVTREKVEEEKPDIVIIAAGAVPAGLDIPGGNGSNVVQANDVITGKVEAAGKIAVIGGSNLALETAVLLAERGKEVTVVSHSGPGGRKGTDDMITFRGLLRRLANMGVPLYLNVPILEISGNHLMINYWGEILPLPADTVVLAVGAKPLDSLAGEIKGLVPQIYTIGDCVMPGNAAQATYSAARLVAKL